MKKLILGMFVVAVSMFGLQNSANATLISQDIYFTDATTSDSVLFGNLSINVDGLTADNNEVNVWESFTLGGLIMDVANINDFFAVVDFTDLAAGIEAFSFDVSDAFDNAYQGYYDRGFVNELSIFDAATDTLTVFGGITLGQATVVPEPAALLLMLTAFGAIAMRRRKFK